MRAARFATILLGAAAAASPCFPAQRSDVGQAPPLSATAAEPVWSEEPPRQPIIRPAESPAQVFRTRVIPPNGVRLQANGVPLSTLLREAHGVPPGRMLEEGGRPRGLYYVDLMVPDVTKEDWRPVLRRVLAERLGARARLERRAVDVLVLRPMAGQTVTLRPAKAGGTVRTRVTPEGVEATNAPVEALVEALESALPLPVVDETRLAGHYDFTFEWEPGSRASIGSELTRVGLELAAARREVEMLVIEGEGGRRPPGG